MGDVREFLGIIDSILRILSAPALVIFAGWASNMDWPQIAIAAGLTLAAVGLGMQVYRGRTATVAASATQQASRSLTKEQKDTLAADLKNHGWEPATVTLLYATGCEECKRYAADFADAFVRAGWNGSVNTSDDEAPDGMGVMLHVADPNNPPQTSRLLQAALKEVGVSAVPYRHEELDAKGTFLWVYSPEA